MRWHIIWTIYRKELTEALRDRVTLLVLIGLPLLLYPLGTFTTFQVAKQQITSEQRRVLKVAVWGVGGVPLYDWLSPTNQRLKLERWLGAPASLRGELEAGRMQPPPQTNPPPPAEFSPRLGGRKIKLETAPDHPALRAAREVVTQKQADAVLILWPGFDDALQRQACGEVSVYYDSVVPQSAQAWARLAEQLDRFRAHLREQRQRERGLPAGFIRALDVSADDVAPIQRRVSDLLGRLLPVLLILLAVVGAVVAAADMTAGEKDRATMQTLLCAPIRSREIVGGKFLAVWSLSLLTAIMHLVGIGLVVSRLAAVVALDFVHWGTLLAALGLLLPATWTISACFLAVAVLARDVKDAGNFLGTAAFAVILPMSVTLMPGVEFDAWTCCVPLVNLVLLVRALMIGEVAAPLLGVTVLTSLAYAGLALGLAARVFGREQSLLGGAFSWRWLLRGDGQRAAEPTPGLVFILFALAVVGLFYGSLTLAQHGLATVLLATQFGGLLLPALAVAVARRFPLAETFSLRRPHWRSVLGSVLIGASASVAIAGLVLRLAPPPESFAREMLELLKFGDSPAPLWKLWLLLAFTPALCEETFFRGLLLSGLRRWRPWLSIGVTALLFALLHGSIYRLLPTFTLGLLLGYAVWRSGSLSCSVIIHGLNNGLIATLIWWQGAEAVEVQAVPWSLTLGALAITSVGLALLTGPKASKANAPPAA